MVNSNPAVFEAERKEQSSALAQWEKEIRDACEKANEAVITIENKLDGEGPPQSFEYVANYIAGKNVTIPNEPVIYCCCDKDENDQWNCGNCQNCCPKLNDSKFAYVTASGRSVKDRRVAIFECNSK